MVQRSPVDSRPFRWVWPEDTTGWSTLRMVVGSATNAGANPRVNERPRHRRYTITARVSMIMAGTCCHPPGTALIWPAALNDACSTPIARILSPVSTSWVLGNSGLVPTPSNCATGRLRPRRRDLDVAAKRTSRKSGLKNRSHEPGHQCTEDRRSDLAETLLIDAYVARSELLRIPEVDLEK
jgi:hypothetical protein